VIFTSILIIELN